MDQIYVSPSGAAELLDCSVKTIRRMWADGRLRAYRLGPRIVRLKVAELESLYEEIPPISLDARLDSLTDDELLATISEAISRRSNQVSVGAEPFEGFVAGS